VLFEYQNTSHLLFMLFRLARRVYDSEDLCDATAQTRSSGDAHNLYSGDDRFDWLS
jgi:hypothetical protein